MLKHELVEAQQMRGKDAEKHRREEARLQERHEALVRFTKVKLSCPFDPFFSYRLSLEALLYAGPSVLFSRSAAGAAGCLSLGFVVLSYSGCYGLVQPWLSKPGSSDYIQCFFSLPGEGEWRRVEASLLEERKAKPAP